MTLDLANLPPLPENPTLGRLEARSVSVDTNDTVVNLTPRPRPERTYTTVVDTFVDEDGIECPVYETVTLSDEQLEAAIAEWEEQKRNGWTMRFAGTPVVTCEATTENGTPVARFRLFDGKWHFVQDLWPKPWEVR